MPGARVAAVVANMPRHMLPGNREVPLNVDTDLYIPNNSTEEEDGMDGGGQQWVASQGGYISISDTNCGPIAAHVVPLVEPPDHSDA